MRFPTAVILFIAAVVSTAVIVLIAFSDTISWGEFPQILTFALLIILASYLHAQDPAGGVVSSTATIFYSAIFIFNPITAFFVVAMGYALGNTLPRPWVTWRACFNGAQMGLSVLLGSIAYRGLGGSPTAPIHVAQVMAFVLGPLVHQIANNFFIAFPISKMRRTPFFRTWASFVQEFLWTNILSIPSAVLIAVLYTRVHHVFVLIFLFSLPFQRWVMKLYLEERNSYIRIIESLVRAGELSLPGMKGHARRVADLSIAIGRQMGLIEREVESIEYAALLHDVGMIGLDDVVLSGEVFSDPQRWIGEHVKVGAEIVGELPRAEIAEMVLNHHPISFPGSRSTSRKGLASRGVRIIALAEEVDSQLHGLFPYSEPEPLGEVLRFVVTGRGSAFDPDVVDAFLAVYQGTVSGTGESLVQNTSPLVRGTVAGQ